MGFCFNRQVNMLHAMSSVKGNKTKKSTQSKVIHKAVFKRERHQHRRQLSVEDHKFLKSIGLRLRGRRRRRQH